MHYSFECWNSVTTFMIWFTFSFRCMFTTSHTAEHDNIFFLNWKQTLQYLTRDVYTARAMRELEDAASPLHRLHWLAYYAFQMFCISIFHKLHVFGKFFYISMDLSMSEWCMLRAICSGNIQWGYVILTRFLLQQLCICTGRWRRDRYPQTAELVMKQQQILKNVMSECHI
jgi:hypothetical protein